jgi:predicted component of type VI protein secretion system
MKEGPGENASEAFMNLFNNRQQHLIWQGLT